MTAPKAVYKIRRKSDGLFSSGGSCPGFSTRGKVWTNIGHVKNHLNQSLKYFKDIYEDCEVVAFEVVEIELETRAIGSVIDQMKEIHAERDRLRKERWAAYERERKEREFAKLAKELGKG